MPATQSLATFVPPAPTGGLFRASVWRAVSSLAHALPWRSAGAATDRSRLSPHMLRDIGLVHGEPPYVDTWGHDFRS